MILQDPLVSRWRMNRKWATEELGRRRESRPTCPGERGERRSPALSINSHGGFQSLLSPYHPNVSCAFVVCHPRPKRSRSGLWAQVAVSTSRQLCHSEELPSEAPHLWQSLHCLTQHGEQSAAVCICQPPRPVPWSWGTLDIAIAGIGSLPYWPRWPCSYNYEEYTLNK